MRLATAEMLNSENNIKGEYDIFYKIIFYKKRH